VKNLEKRGIQVQRDVCRDEAAAMLKYYLSISGEIYNG
jgi:pyrimidine deaminase RibD-like protein